jgi:hypothetical protein
MKGCADGDNSNSCGYGRLARAVLEPAGAAGNHNSTPPNQESNSGPEPLIGHGDPVKLAQHDKAGAAVGGTEAPTRVATGTSLVRFLGSEPPEPAIRAHPPPNQESNSGPEPLIRHRDYP